MDKGLGNATITQSEINFNRLDELFEIDIMSLEGEGGLVWNEANYLEAYRYLQLPFEDFESRNKNTLDSEFRNYRVLRSELPHFNVSFTQRPHDTFPSSFDETLEFVLKKEVWGGHLSMRKPSSLAFLDDSSFSEANRVYFSSPKFNLKMSTSGRTPILQFKSERMFDNLLEGWGSHNISITKNEPFKNILDSILWGSFHPKPTDLIFTGCEGALQRELLLEQMQNFGENILKAYGLAMSQNGRGVSLSRYHYGT